MPLFSEHITNMYYSGTPSYSSSPYSYSGSPYGTSYSASYLNSGGNYSNHSSLTPYTRTLSSRWLLGGGRTYSPILSTISEKGTSSPVRINSPRRTPISSRSYISSSYTPRPININTADIDVSREKYRNKTNASSINTEPRRPSPLSNKKTESLSNDAEKKTGVDSSPGSPPQRSTIKRDRPVVRLHTVKRKDRDSPRKPIDSSYVESSSDVTTQKDKLEPLKWRERLADDLTFKNKKEKKTIGEKLVEKFTLKDKDDSDIDSNTIETSSDQHLDEPGPVPLTANVAPIDNTKSLGRRCSMELLAEQASLLDSLIRRENLSTATVDLSKIGSETAEKNEINETSDDRKRKFIHQPNPLTTTKSDQSILTKRGTKRKSLRKSTSGENICKLDRISEMPQLSFTESIPVIDSSKSLNKNNTKILGSKPKLKQKITSSVEVSSPPMSPLKFIVENVTVEEKPLSKKKDIIFSSVIDDVNVNIKPKKLASNAVDTGHRKSVKIKLRSEQKNIISEDVVSPEPEDGNFWGKIGKRETVYLNNRKKDLDNAKEDKKRSFSWFPGEDKELQEQCNITIDTSKDSSQLNIVTNNNIEHLRDKLETINNKAQKDEQPLEIAQNIETNLNLNVSDKNLLSNYDQQEIEKELSKSEETSKGLDQSNSHLLRVNTDKKDITGMNKIENQDQEKKRSAGISTQSVFTVDSKESVISNDSIEKETIPESKKKKQKIVKKIRGSKEKANNNSPEKRISVELNKSGKECNEYNRKEEEIKPKPKNDIANQVLPKSTSEPNLLNTSGNDSSIVKDTNDPLKENDTKLMGENDKFNLVLSKSTPEPNVININKNDSSISKDENGIQKIQNNLNPMPENVELNKISSEKNIFSTNNKDGSITKLVKHDPKIENSSVNHKKASPHDRWENIEKNESGKETDSEKDKSYASPEILQSMSKTNQVTKLQSDNNIVNLQRDEKNNDDPVRINEENFEGAKEQQMEEKNIFENKHKVTDLNKEIIVKHEDIPRANTELRLSQKQKTDDVKTDIENTQNNKRESIKKPNQNAGINVFFANKKPIKDVPAPKPLIATPRPLQKKAPQVIRSSSSSDTSSSEDSSDEDEDEDESSESSNGYYECENNVDGRTSTGSNDSGFDSSAPASPSGFSYVRKDCDVNCHRKCEKLTANLCGVNQRLLVEALASRTASKRGADNPTTSTSAAQNNNHDIIQQELEQSTAYGIFRKTGRFTPPARSIPRFRKYTIDDFQFIKVLGKGSFGKVMLAELRETEYYYAVKCLKKDVVLEDDDVECTLIERKVLALGTNHPYLCHLFATFQTDSHLFFVMEYLNGGDLMFHIQQSGRFPEPRARLYAAEIVSGLKFLHKRGIVYRDLKLDNILLDFDGHVRIADFGMCKLQIYLDKTADTFCGTPDYMAPEIIKGLKYNQTVDWWSFGVLLYEMLIGQSPFSGCDEDELFWSICNEMPSYPRFLSSESLSILTRLLDKDARTRLGGAECMHGDIREQDFFKPINWEKLERRELEAPIKPRVRHPLDTQYFDRAFTGERPRLTAVEPQVLRSMDQEPFRGFSYTNPNATDR